MKVYHGGTDIIKSPLVNVGREGLDFGIGFYVTPNREQALEWAKRVSDRRMKSPVLNEYELDYSHILHEFKCKIFDKYNDEWLKFIAENRKYGKHQTYFDFVEGGIADDRVVDTIEAFIADLISADEALNRLIYQKPNNQICILNQEIIDKFLHFTSAITI